MSVDSSVLFIAICSNNKQPGGKRYNEFSYDDRIISDVSLQLGKQLLSSRQRILHVIQDNDEARLANIPVKNLPLSQGLVAGPDFGASILDETGGHYLPAIQRYSGRFFLGLGRDRFIRLRQTRHHVLFISGLYGLVKPFELVQSYSCHVNYHPDIVTTWQNGDLLGRVLS